MNCRQRGENPAYLFKSIFENYLPLLVLTGLVLLLPDTALASGIDEFAGPVEKVMNTVTGRVGKAVAVVGIAICGYVLITQRDDLSGWAKSLLAAVIGICFIAFALPIVNSLFSFSGAVI